MLVVMMASASLGISVIGATEGGEEKPVKYAPAYCRSLRFNCRVKAGHVCCRFPLPPTGFVRLRLSLTLCQLSTFCQELRVGLCRFRLLGTENRFFFAIFGHRFQNPDFGGSTQR